MARPPTAAEHELVGHYYIGDGLDRRLCAITLSFEPTVGGEITADGCAAKAPQLDRAVRSWVDAKRGGLTFADALHKIQVTFADSDGGLIAGLDHDRLLTLAPYKRAFLTNPGADVPGRWTYSNEGGDDPTGGCVVQFGKGSIVTVTPRCPRQLSGVNGGRWQATPSTVKLSKGDIRMALAWGASRDSLFFPDSRFRIERQH